MPNPPTQKQAVSSITTGDTIANTRTLGATARVYAEIGIILRNAVSYSNIIGLLETDSIPIVVSHDTTPNDCPKGSI